MCYDTVVTPGPARAGGPVSARGVGGGRTGSAATLTVTMLQCATVTLCQYWSATTTDDSDTGGTYYWQCVSLHLMRCLRTRRKRPAVAVSRQILSDLLHLFAVYSTQHEPTPRMRRRSPC
jgi:hypothetical protein